VSEPHIDKGKHGFVDFADDVEFGPMCYIQAEGGVVIGKGVKIGACVKILTIENADGGVERCMRVQIDEGVVIGAGVLILPGTNIGKGSIIAPGAVVVGDIPARSFVSPAIGQIFPLDEAEAEEPVPALGGEQPKEEQGPAFFGD